MLDPREEHRAGALEKSSSSGLFLLLLSVK